MARVPMIEHRDQAGPAQIEAFDHIAGSRGGMPKPFAALLHRPDVARAVADLGAVLRFGSTLPDADRELAIYTTAVAWECRFEQAAHLSLARQAGVAEATLAAVLDGAPVTREPDALVVDFARQLSRSATVDAGVFTAARERFGEEGAVELSALVGYYTLLALVIGALEVD